MEDFSISKIQDLAASYGIKLIGAIIILIVGFWVVGKISGLIRKRFEKTDMEVSLQKFLTSIISVLLKVLVILAAVANLGVETTGIIAILGAAGLAVGLALQGSLANFAGGVLILLFKPYKVGDVIESQGYLGVVKAIEIFNTIINTPENKTIILPNASVSNNPIVNVSTNGFLRLDIPVGIGYSDDIDKAKEVLFNVLKSDPAVMQDQAITSEVLSLGESSVDLAVRCHVKVEDYWAAHFRLHKAVKEALDKEGLEIPFPQRVLHQQ